MLDNRRIFIRLFVVKRLSVIRGSLGAVVTIATSVTKPQHPLLATKPGERLLLLGDEAVARGALEAGIAVATSYPGTPASEILSTLATVADAANLYVEWSVNEKVAFEVAYAAALAGCRALFACKHLGMNWVMDPLLVAAETGVNAGFVIVVADDIHPHASQTAEDTRWYARIAKLPCIEPADVQEAKDAIPAAVALSERLQQPVIVRLTTRICHSRQDVEFGPIRPPKRRATFVPDPRRYVMIAPYARSRQAWLNQQLDRAREEGERWPFNRIEEPERAELGIIAVGAAYPYVREAIRRLGVIDRVSVLKLGFTHPLPAKLLASFLHHYPRILVVEEGDPVVEREVKALATDLGISIRVLGKESGHLPREHELTVGRVESTLCILLGVTNGNHVSADYEAPSRIPYLCAGCPHRGSYLALKEVLREAGGGVVCGDRGCYNQGIHPPLQAIDTCICMGASIAMAVGFAKSGVNKPVVAVIGDSTFWHAGLPPLIDAVWNRAPILVYILDNSWTAMTGHQPCPSTGRDTVGNTAPQFDVVAVCKALNVGFVEVTDPYNIPATKEVLRRALQYIRDTRQPAVVIARRECALVRRRRKEREPQPTIDPEKCVGCLRCITVTGCPALTTTSEGKVTIDSIQCFGCRICSYYCPTNAIQ